MSRYQPKPGFIPERSEIFFGADPCWSPARERYTDRHTPPEPEVYCPTCGFLPAGTLISLGGQSVATTEDCLTIPACLGDDGSFLLEDGTVLVIRLGSDPIFDSDLVVVACASCQRVPERFDGYLRGRLAEGARIDEAGNAQRPGPALRKLKGRMDPGVARERIARNLYVHPDDVPPSIRRAIRKAQREAERANRPKRRRGRPRKDQGGDPSSPG